MYRDHKRRRQREAIRRSFTVHEPAGQMDSAVEHGGQDSPRGMHTWIRTQNVRGLVKTDAAAWFQHLRRLQGGERVGLTLLQETHCTESDAAALERQHAALWGYRADAEPRLSYWSRGGRAGGVAILLHPDEAHHWEPARQDMWSPFFIALHGTQDGQRTLLCNVYGSTDKAERESLLVRLVTYDVTAYERVVIGGDFNSTQLPTDRSTGRTGSHHSPALAALQRTWKLEDAGARLEAASEWTYYYATATGDARASRLDRVYISVTQQDWVRRHSTLVAPLNADHRGVVMGLAHPTRQRVRRPRTKLYPPPLVAVAAAREIIQAELADMTTDGAVTVDAWEERKRLLSKRLARCYMDCKRKQRRSTKQQLKRATAALRRLELRNPTTLSLTDRAECCKIRASIATLHTAWQHRTQHAREAARQAADWKSTRAAFQRVSTKRAAQTIDSIRPTPGFPNRTAAHVADSLADGWVATLTSCRSQTPAAAQLESARVRDYVQGATKRLTAQEGSDLDADITEDEVRQAMASLDRYKSPGPDQLPNDFYLDYAEQLVGPLTRLFQECWRLGRYPDGHREATIFAVAKAGPSDDPLKYRPLAMLNTDYKLFAKVLANRLRRVVRHLLHPDQHAFVPGRTIHEAIDVLAACWLQHADTGDPTDPAAVVMLDFAKAYDSLERDYLYAVLDNMGLPPRFTQFVRDTHTGTTVKFLVNGGLSRCVTVTRGIRQGCPLAPMLFVLGLEPLIAAVERDPEVHGLRLRALDHDKEVTIVAYADDTTVYVAHASQLERVRRLLDDFAQVSGLSINVHKSIAIPFGRSDDAEWTTQFAVPADGDVTRYLGVQVGRGVDGTATWDAALRGLRLRLTLAERRLHTVAQRAQLARAIIIPKLLYVARHAFPTRTQREAAQRFIDDYVWGSTCALHQTRRSRGWIGRATAQLALKDGGLAIPCLRLELQMLGVRAILRWNDLLLTAARSATTVLIDSALRGWLYDTPTGVHCVLPQSTTTGPPRLGLTIWSTGVQALSFAVDMDATWDGEGVVAPQWLDAVRVSDLGDVGIGLDGDPDESYHAVRDLTVRQCLDAQPDLDGCGPQSHQLALTRIQDLAAAVSSARERLRGADELWEATPTADTTEYSWHVQLRDDGRVVLRHWTGGTAAEAPAIETATSIPQHLTRVPPALRPTALLPHPLTSRLVWPKPIPMIKTGPVRRRLNRVHRVRGLADAERRRHKSDESNSTFQKATAVVPPARWRRGISPLSDGDKEYWHRLHLQALRVWTEADGVLCDCSTCPDTRATLAHVLWDCALAKAVWQRVLHDWGGGDLDGWRDQVLTGQLDEQPVDYWQLLLDGDGPRATTAPAGALTLANGLSGLQPAVDAAWLVQVTLTLRALWARRFLPATQRARRDASAIYFAVHTNVTRRLRVHTSALWLHGGGCVDTAVCLKRVAAAFAARTLPSPHVPPVAAPTWILTFDGGSRGNPGAGGAGCALVRVGGAGPVLVWGCATYMPAKTTTNNAAEVRGLLEGIRQAWRMGATPLEVIGDSNLILNWMRRRRPPKTPALQRAYERARHFADRLHVTAWTHQYRAANKVADRLANAAMDAKTTMHIRACADPNYQQHPVLWAELCDFLTTDLDPWRERRTATRPPP